MFVCHLSSFVYQPLFDTDESKKTYPNQQKKELDESTIQTAINYHTHMKKRTKVLEENPKKEKISNRERALRNLSPDMNPKDIDIESLLKGGTKIILPSGFY